MTMTAIDGRGAIGSYLEHEHQELVVGLDRIDELARELPDLPADRQAPRLAAVLHWVDSTLRPHLAWEERWLFPQLDRRIEDAMTTRFVGFGHRQILAQVDRLARHQVVLAHGTRRERILEARADLFALGALIRATLECEEAFLVPLLEPRGADRWEPEWRD